MWTVNLLSLTTDFEMSETCELLSWYLRGCNSTSRYLDDLMNIDYPYFEGMVNQIYPPELQLNKANIPDTEAPFLDLHLSEKPFLNFIVDTMN